MTDEPLELYEPSQATVLGFRRPALFLSAGVPFERTSGTDAQIQANARYLPPRRTEIRTAVVQLARFAFARDVQLVFGGHPAISPLVLRTTRAVPPSGEPRVFVFQSAYFQHVLPRDTMELANWCNGRLLWTRSAGLPQAPDTSGDPAVREPSLALMREAMVTVPGLVGAVFIGGMDGVEAEADLFRGRQPHLPCYALPGTGSAARRLFEANPRAFAGTLATPDVLDTTVFTRALAWVFEDLAMA